MDIHESAMDIRRYIYGYLWMHSWISMNALMDNYRRIHGYPLLYGYPSSITHVGMDIHGMDF